MSKRPDGLSPYIEPRISFLIPLPELQRAKVWRRIRVGAERRSLRAQKSGAYHRRRKSLRRCAIREVYEPLTLSALRDRSDPRPKMSTGCHGANVLDRPGRRETARGGHRPVSGATLYQRLIHNQNLLEPFKSKKRRSSLFLRRTFASAVQQLQQWLHNQHRFRVHRSRQFVPLERVDVACPERRTQEHGH